MSEPQVKSSIAGRKAELEGALMGFPDEWDMIEQIAGAFVKKVTFKPEPTMRKLKPEEEPHSPMEKEGYSRAWGEWYDEHRKIEEEYESALKMLAEWKKTKNELATFGKRK